VIELTEKQVELRALASGEAKHILAVGGSRSGKTFALCYFIDRRAWAAPGSRHLVYRKHAVSARQSIGIDTFPKVHALTGDPLPKFHAQDGYFEYANGSQVWLAGLDDSNVDKVLGREYATVYGNEASEFAFAIREQVLTRLAQSVKKVDGSDLALKEYLDLNPTTTSHWTYKTWVVGAHPESGKAIDRTRYKHLFVNPYDNVANLPASMFDTLRDMGERNRRRFLLGEYSADVEEAIWRRSMILRAEPPGDMQRIVVAVDPATTSNAGSDETGIVVAGIKGIGSQTKGYVIDDASGKFRPEEWARVALSLYHETQADCIVAEANQGGDMVESVIRSIEANSGTRSAHIKLVHASRGKVIRAEPIAGLYERKLVYHLDEFPELEDQMCSITTGFDRRAQGYSPDRVDALVWAMTELFPPLSKTNAIPIRPIRREKRSFFA